MLLLLDVQELDTKRNAAQYRLERLPEAEQLAELKRQRAGVEGQVRDLRISVTDLTDEQQRADADVEQVRARRERDQGMVDSGAISDPKALQSMMGELESLARRIATLEDVEIEVMERLEQAQSDLSAGEQQLTALDDQLEQAQAALDQARAGLAAEISELGANRDRVAQ
ncbi:MAG TPA: hypothetical protein PLC19_05795, partial [Marmoricola sp.]|nr:hypothetical protein [Marmoricola sp.]